MSEKIFGYDRLEQVSMAIQEVEDGEMSEAQAFKQIKFIMDGTWSEPVKP